MKISEDVLAVLSTLSIDGAHVRITEQLDRNLYTKVNKVLEALGGTWTRKVKAHVFPGDAGERIELAITTGEVEVARDIGWFPTPAPLAAKLVELADVRRGHYVLEPSAGTGAIVEAIIKHRPSKVLAIEYRHERVEVLRAKLDLKDWRDVGAILMDFMDFECVNVRALDLIPATRHDDRFDRVVMNPPFCRSGRGDHLDHVRHAFEMLKPGGVLVSVLPAGIEFRNDRRHRETRGWILEHGTLERLPEGSFKSSGTSVNTCVARMERRA